MCYSFCEAEGKCPLPVSPTAFFFLYHENFLSYIVFPKATLIRHTKFFRINFDRFNA